MSARKLSLTPHDIETMKDCPFCGEKDLELRSSDAFYWVTCLPCERVGNNVEICGEDCTPITGVAKTTAADHRRAKRSAIREWNRRPCADVDDDLTKSEIVLGQSVSQLGKAVAVLLTCCPGCGKKMSGREDLGWLPNKAPFRWHPKCAERCFDKVKVKLGK